MSARSDLLQDADQTELRLDHPALIAVLVGCAAAAIMLLAATASSSEPVLVDELAAEASADPTPYSQMHAAIPASAQDEEQAPTF